MKPILFIFPLCQVTPAINLWGQSGKILTMYASRCALAVLKYITTPNSCTFFTYPSFFFCWWRRKRSCILFPFCMFSWFNKIKKNLWWSIKYLPKSNEDYKHKKCDSTWTLSPCNICIMQSYFKNNLLWFSCTRHSFEFFFWLFINFNQSLHSQEIPAKPKWH